MHGSQKTLELKGQVHTVACFGVRGKRGYQCCYLKSILNAVKIGKKKDFKGEIGFC